MAEILYHSTFGHEASRRAIIYWSLEGGCLSFCTI
jgi:hypothetical protein